MLATAAHALSNVSFETLRVYLADLLAPSIVVVPTLLAVVGCAAWKALRENGAWTLLALTLLFQVPICLLLTVERWALRQFLVPRYWCSASWPRSCWRPPCKVFERCYPKTPLVGWPGNIG